ncbi:hypothetical protein SASPL_109481 [Salvia splendens]|uniref:Disease resistance protein winged helix domain-containing protein n=1 Tax=Salvia splendens TaxID=180675 RepID=A0A8X9A6D0_SALSN|nr:hypothetical protein SASPL_109481 [Salvia splendens]
MLHQKLSNPESLSLTYSAPDLLQVTQELDLAMEQVVKLKEEKKTMLSGASSSHGEVQQQLESVNLVEEGKEDAGFIELQEPFGSGLKTLWIAEGFVKCNGDKSLEEVAEDYLKALVERNILSVVRKKTNGKPLGYSMHDLLRDLCIKKAKEEKFLLVKNSMRHVSVQSSYEMEDVCASPQLMSLVRYFLCTHDDILSPVFGILRLIRVLDVFTVVFEKFSEEILQLVNLWYLAFSCTSGFPVGISRLWNLQTLVCGEEISYLPPEIWEQSELRYLRLFSILKMDEEYMIRCVHKKLHTITFVWFLNLVRWKADESNFPKLEHLILCNCHELEEIPSAIGDIASLQEIEIHECGASN